MRRELIVDRDPKSALSESIKNIRTNLQFSSVDGKIKNILITSSTSGEGKSFVTANLAIAFAKLGNKVLVVDCDMRLGRQHEIFGLSNSVGLSNLLIDEIEQKYEKNRSKKCICFNTWNCTTKSKWVISIRKNVLFNANTK